MKKNMLYKFDKKLFVAYGAYNYAWTMGWCREKKYEIIERYVIDDTYFILVKTPTYFSSFPKKSIPIFRYDINDNEVCRGSCARTLKKQIEKEI